MDADKLESHIILDVLTELHKAKAKFPGYNSGHEAYAVILEELQELWEEVKADNCYSVDAYKEAIQVAVTAFRAAEMIYERTVK